MCLSAEISINNFIKLFQFCWDISSVRALIIYCNGSNGKSWWCWTPSVFWTARTQQPWQTTVIKEVSCGNTRLCICLLYYLKTLFWKAFTPRRMYHNNHLQVSSLVNETDFFFHMKHVRKHSLACVNVHLYVPCLRSTTNNTFRQVPSVTAEIIMSLGISA